MKYKKEKGECGMVREYKEEKMAMLNNGGKKYSKDNPIEMKQREDKLAAQVKKGY